MPKKILIVEDHPDSRELLRIQIEHMDYEVIRLITENDKNNDL